MWISPIEYMITLLTPTQCYICKTDGIELCESCFEIINKEVISRCYKCNKLTRGQTVCASCSSRLRRVWWLGTYELVLKDLIHQMKYHRQRSLARTFGRYMAQTLPYIAETTLVIPIPTATKRIRQRGFDQAALIAQTFATQRQLPLHPLLYRTSSVDLVGKSRPQRIEAMAKSLGISHAEQLKGKNIILIDDVLTTGATLEAAAALLRQHGVKHVDAAIVARDMLQ